MAEGCPNCGSLAAIIMGSTITAMHCPSFRDKLGQVHTHNINRVTTGYQCSYCTDYYYETAPHSCWCGWKQEER